MKIVIAVGMIRELEMGKLVVLILARHVLTMLRYY
jgi:hypothetical protein